MAAQWLLAAVAAQVLGAGAPAAGSRPDRIVIEATAGGAVVSVAGYRGAAGRIVYDAAERTVILTGTAGRPATLARAAAAGRPEMRFTGDRITYSLKDGRVTGSRADSGTVSGRAPRE
jgi:lipopolysaccharide export system protein LptA